MPVPILDASYPTEGSRAFGYRRSPTHVHQGVDVVVPEGTPVYAARSGVVEVSHDGDSRRRGFTGYGKVNVLLHDDGNRTLYAHLQRALATEGDTVRGGEKIGTAGKTAYNQPPDYDNLFSHSSAHLHFEVSPRPYPQDSEAPRLDPVAWLKEDAAGPSEPVLPDPVDVAQRTRRASGGDFFAWAAVLVGTLWLTRGGG